MRSRTSSTGGPEMVEFVQPQDKRLYDLLLSTFDLEEYEKNRPVKPQGKVIRISGLNRCFACGLKCNDEYSSVGRPCCKRCWNALQPKDKLRFVKRKRTPLKDKRIIRTYRHRKSRTKKLEEIVPAPITVQLNLIYTTTTGTVTQSVSVGISRTVTGFRLRTPKFDVGEITRIQLFHDQVFLCEWIGTVKTQDVYSVCFKLWHENGLVRGCLGYG